MLRHCSWETYKYADKAPSLHHLPEKSAEMRTPEQLFPSNSSRCLLSVCFSPDNMVSPKSIYGFSGPNGCPRKESLPYPKNNSRLTFYKEILANQCRRTKNLRAYYTSH